VAEWPIGHPGGVTDQLTSRLESQIDCSADLEMINSSSPWDAWHWAC